MLVELFIVAPESSLNQYVFTPEPVPSLPVYCTVMLEDVVSEPLVGEEIVTVGAVES